MRRGGQLVEVVHHQWAVGETQQGEQGVALAEFSVRGDVDEGRPVEGVPDGFGARVGTGQHAGLRVEVAEGGDLTVGVM